MSSSRSGVNQRRLGEAFPNQLVRKVFLHLELADLLRCRLVNKVFLSVASEVCRSRFVMLDLNWSLGFSSNLGSLYVTFSDKLDDLPWSACKLFSWREKKKRSGLCYDSLSETQINHFLRTFGTHIKKLHLGGNNSEVIVKILKGMPNLEILRNSSSEGIFDDDVIMHTRISLKLNHLRRLQMEIQSRHQVRLLEILLKSVPAKAQLEYIRVSMLARNGISKYAQRVAALIAKIPWISLDLMLIGSRQIEPYNTFAALKLRVRELELRIPEPHPGRPGFYRPLETFLASNSDCLEKLSIYDCEWDPETFAPRLTIPRLAELKFLKIHSDEGILHPPLTLVSPFLYNQFPTLRKVKVVFVNGFFNTFTDASFPSARHLILKDYSRDNANPMQIDWDRVFPNITELDVRGVSSESLAYICANMTQLERLALRVNTRADSYDSEMEVWNTKGNANSILSGYPTGFYANMGWEGDSSHTLAALTRLRSLRMDFRDCDEFSEYDVHDALLQLHRLDYLCLRNTMINEESRVKLIAHHARFETMGTSNHFAYVMES